MNVIAYIKPATGEIVRVRCSQPSYTEIARRFKVTGWFGRRGTMAMVDEAMRRRGFVRAGRRWAKPADRRAYERVK